MFDQHGNVAEIMTRRDRDDGKLYSQLKGSAWFYVEVAREHDAPRPKGRETYPDHCAYSPRWHVEPMEDAWHANYHLGLRGAVRRPLTIRDAGARGWLEPGHGLPFPRDGDASAGSSCTDYRRQLR